MQELTSDIEGLACGLQESEVCGEDVRHALPDVQFGLRAEFRRPVRVSEATGGIVIHGFAGAVTPSRVPCFNWRPRGHSYAATLSGKSGKPLPENGPVSSQRYWNDRLTNTQSSPERRSRSKPTQ